MAKLDFVYAIEEINVSESVGRGGANRRNDVLVVQALLKYGLSENHYFRGEHFTEPNGMMDHNTITLIKSFQRYLRRIRKINVSVDGRIDSAKGVKAFGRKGKWTIQQLNGMALETYVLSRGDAEVIKSSFIFDLVEKFPQIKTALPDLPVGSLELALE